MVASSVFPLSVAVGGRYVQSQDGTPFLLHAEAAWFITSLSLANATAYLDELVSKGINCVRIMAPPYWDNAPVANANGDFAFSTPGNFTTAFVSAWWNHLEAIIAAALARGIVVSIAVLYNGFDGDGTQGWWLVTATKSAAQVQAYGAAVATRLASYPNIIWEGLGDFVPADGALTSALVAGLRSVSPARLCTGEPVRGDTSAVQQPSGGNWDLNFAYPFQAAYAQVLTAWNQNVGPVATWEPYYEHRTGTSPTDITVRQVRASMWFAATYGSPLYCYGNERIWDFDTGRSPDGIGHSPYTAAYNDPGRLTYQAHGNFLRAIQWWRLVPDTGSTLITSSRGTNGSETYVTVSRSTSPQDLALIYAPSGGSITAAMSGFSGSVTATRVDPSNGNQTSLGTFANSGSQTFNLSAGGNNAAGDPDQVLLLKAA